MRNPADIHPISLKAIYEHYAIQKADELTFILCLLEPNDIVLEIGCDAGGTTWAIQQVGCKRFIGVDLPGEKGSSGLAWQGDGNTEMIWGDSHAAGTKMKLLTALGEDKPTFTIIDGDHTYAGVADDFRMYGRQLSTGLVIFHDVNTHHELEWVKVNQFYNEIKDRYPHTEYFSHNTQDGDWGGIGVLDLSQEGRLERALQQVQRETA